MKICPTCSSRIGHDMSDAASQIEPLPCGPVVGHPRIAWLLIGTLVVLSITAQRSPEKATNPVALSELQRRILEVQGKYLVAAAQTSTVQKSQMYQSARSLNSGSLLQRMAFVALAGELAGPEEALRQVQRTKHLVEKSRDSVPDSQKRVFSTLEKLYQDYQNKRWSAPSLGSSDGAQLVAELGWFGSLALAPQGATKDFAPNAAMSATRQAVMASAWKTFVVVLLVLGTVTLVGFAGLAGAIVFMA